jgi:hypothetical protein
MSKLQNVKSQYQYINWKLLTPDLLDLVLCPPAAKVSVIWSIKCVLKEFYCVSEASLIILKFELWFVRGDCGLLEGTVVC